MADVIPAGTVVRAEKAEPKWVPVKKVLPEGERRLTIGIVGFGLFGQFIGRRMALAGHRVIATSRADYSKEAEAMDVEFIMWVQATEHVHGSCMAFAPVCMPQAVTHTHTHTTATTFKRVARMGLCVFCSMQHLSTSLDVVWLACAVHTGTNTTFAKSTPTSSFW